MSQKLTSIPAVAPQMKCRPYGMAQKNRVLPSNSALQRWWLRRSRRKLSGTSKISATSCGSGLSVKGGLDQANHRRDHEPGARHVGVEPADDFDVPAIEPHLLFRLAQRRFRRPAVLRLDVTTGEADLTRMVGEMRGALGEQHR